MSIFAFLAILLSIYLAYFFNAHLIFPVELPDLPEPDFGSGVKKSSPEIRSFKIQVANETLQKLRSQLLEESILFESLPGTKFTLVSKHELWYVSIVLLIFKVRCKRSVFTLTQKSLVALVRLAEMAGKAERVSAFFDNNCWPGSAFCVQ